MLNDSFESLNLEQSKESNKMVLTKKEEMIHNYSHNINTWKRFTSINKPI